MRACRFAQIAVVAAGLKAFYGVGAEAATACAATLLFVTSLSIIPVGLCWARFEQMSLRRFAQESDAADELAAEPTSDVS